MLELNMLFSVSMRRSVCNVDAVNTERGGLVNRAVNVYGVTINIRGQPCLAASISLITGQDIQ
jgi:hypothetical protein